MHPVGPSKNDSSVSPRNLWIAKVVVTLCFLALLAGAYYRSFSAEKMDFRVYYVAAQMLRQGQASNLYDPELPETFHERYFHSRGQFFIAPPVAAVLYLPSAFLNPRHGYLLWTVFSMAMLWMSAILVNRALQLRTDSFLLMALFYLFLPVHFALLQGQIDVVILLSYAASLYGMMRKQDFWAGMALAIGLVKFQIVLPFALILLLRRRWRALQGFGAGSLVFTAACVAISGPRVFESYLALVQHLSPGSSSGMEPKEMANLRGLFVLFAHHEPNKFFFSCVALGLLLVVAAQWTSLAKGFAAGVVATLLVSYYLNPHGLILLLIPFALVWKTFPWKSATSLSMLVVALPLLPAVAAHWRMFALMALPMLVFGACILFEKPREKKRGDLAIAPADMP